MLTGAVVIGAVVTGAASTVGGALVGWTAGEFHHFFKKKK